MICDFADLFQDGFLVFDDFLGENVGIGKAVDSWRLSSLRKWSRRAHQ
jgi:hypothetical protein